jgi:tripartite ATP-independent transporter DctM subunit
LHVDPALLGLVAISLVLIVFGFPVAFALGVTAAAYLVANGFPLTLAVQEAALSLNSFTMLAIPLFMLAGMVMNAGRITDRIFDFANMAVGRIPGGLGHVNVIASLIFAGMSGSVLADVAGLGSMEIKAMRDKGYDIDFSVGITLASSAIGPILPPSVPMVMFGVIAEVSITGLFLGGVLPGVLIAIALMVYVFWIGKRRHYYRTQRYPWAVVLRSFLLASPPLLTPFIIVGGMTLGIFSPTEAATVAVLYALFLAMVVYRDMPMRDLLRVLREVVVATSKLLFIITMALLFGWVLTVGQMPQQLAVFLGGLFASKWVFLLVVNFVLLVLGAIIENAVLLLILAPMLVPIAEKAFGIDPIHFGVVMVFNIMIGQYTPPMGLSLFVMRDITGLSLKRISLAVAPFLIPLIVSLFIMTYVPWVVLWLPRAMGF